MRCQGVTCLHIPSLFGSTEITEECSHAASVMCSGSESSCHPACGMNALCTEPSAQPFCFVTVFSSFRTLILSWLQKKWSLNIWPFWYEVSSNIICVVFCCGLNASFTLHICVLSPNPQWVVLGARTSRASLIKGSYRIDLPLPLPEDMTRSFYVWTRKWGLQ